MAKKALIRRAGPDDARGIAEVHVASWMAAYAGLLTKERLAQPDVTERERAWRERLAAPEGLQRVWVALVNDSIVGFASTRLSEDDDVKPDTHELGALYLVPGAWRRGIGSALLSAAMKRLAEAGCVEATLWVLEGNDQAISFYERHGWKFDKREPSFRDFGAAAVRYRTRL